MSDEQKKSTPEETGESEPLGVSPAVEAAGSETEASAPAPADDSWDYHQDNYGEPYISQAGGEVIPTTASAEPPPPPSPPSDDEEEDDEDDEGMLRMSFLEHLEELRQRLIWGLSGLAVAFFLCLSFSEWLWRIVQAPAAAALEEIGYKDAGLVFTSPMESFTIIWIKLPLLVSVFVASPWLLYQAWSFIAPGLYKKERRLAAPFIVVTAGLFCIGGLFAYFVAFRFGLTFLLGIGRNVGVRPMITITEYFDIFVNVILGVSLVFELPVLIFFLTLLRVASPSFLLANSRYAILAIVIVAAIITPTPDVFNLMIFSVPMVILFFVGVFASFLLVMSREGRRIPWGRIWLIALLAVLVLAGVGVLAVVRFGYHFSNQWPFLVK